MELKAFVELMQSEWLKATRKEVNQAVLFAQAALETGTGTSIGFTQDKNMFGIKKGSNWQGEIAWRPTWEVVNGKTVRIKAPFRVYKTVASCIENYHDIIHAYSWYRDALPFAQTDSGLFLANIVSEPPSKTFPHGEPGWATDPGYTRKVTALGKQIEALGGPKWLISS
jgi:flagellar protein FlgJ